MRLYHVPRLNRLERRFVARHARQVVCAVQGVGAPRLRTFQNVYLKSQYSFAHNEELVGPRVRTILPSETFGYEDDDFCFTTCQTRTNAVSVHAFRIPIKSVCAIAFRVHTSRAQSGLSSYYRPGAAYVNRPLDNLITATPTSG